MTAQAAGMHSLLAVVVDIPHNSVAVADSMMAGHHGHQYNQSLDIRTLWDRVYDTGKDWKVVVLEVGEAPKRASRGEVDGLGRKRSCQEVFRGGDRVLLL
jgi:hypothetical protein